MSWNGSVGWVSDYVYVGACVGKGECACVCLCNKRNTCA